MSSAENGHSDSAVDDEASAQPQSETRRDSVRTKEVRSIRTALREMYDEIFVGSSELL